MENVTTPFEVSFSLHHYLSILIHHKLGNYLCLHVPSETKHNYWGHTWIESYPSPNAQISFFASWNDAGREQLGNANDNSFRIALNATLLIR